MEAVRAGDLKTVVKMLKSKKKRALIDVDQVTENGETALRVAVMSGYEKIALAMLYARANPYAGFYDDEDYERSYKDSVNELVNEMYTF